MSVKVTKQFNPTRQLSVDAWKFFVLHEDGTLGPLEYYFTDGMIEGPCVLLGRPMESTHGYWLFTDEQEAYRCRRDCYNTPHYILLRVQAIGLMAEGVLADKFPCAKFQTILIQLPEDQAPSDGALATKAARIEVGAPLAKEHEVER